MNDLENNVFLISRRWSHHAGHSGYDLLGHHIGSPITTSRPIPRNILPDRYLFSMTQNVKGYDRTDAALELMTFKHMATRRNKLYHFLYGDTGYNYLSRLNGWRGHKIIASYHHPSHKFWDRVQNQRIIKTLSAVVIVGSNQYKIFDDILPRERIFLVPHHVDTTYFCPPKSLTRREKKLCLFVGSHLRDFETLRQVIENAWIKEPLLEFALVLHPKNIKKLEGVVGNYKIFSNIPDTELLQLYQKATILIQPLHDATANNTVLEAISCGLPAVVTDVGAIQDYVDKSCAGLVPIYDPEVMLETILNLVASPKNLQNMGNAARMRSLEFDCKVIFERMNQVYLQVLCSNGS